MAKQPNFYSVEGAAKALGVPLRECRKLIENGTLRVETITGLQIVRRSNIAKLKARWQKPTAGKSTSDKPKAGKPKVVKPTVVKPMAGKPTVVKPAIGLI